MLPTANSRRSILSGMYDKIAEGWKAVNVETFEKEGHKNIEATHSHCAKK